MSEPWLVHDVCSSLVNATNAAMFMQVAATVCMCGVRTAPLVVASVSGTDNADQYGMLIGKMSGTYSSGARVSCRRSSLITSILGTIDGNPAAGCANFCFAPGGRIICLAEDRVYLIEGLKVEGALATMTTA